MAFDPIFPFVLLLLCLLKLQYANAKVNWQNTAELLDAVGGKLGSTNTVIGSYSRLLSVSAILREQRGDDSVDVQESLNLAITTLSLLDIGGGILAPIADNIIDGITTERAFAATKNAMLEYGNPMTNNNLGDLTDLKVAELKSLLKTQKNKALKAFGDDVMRAQGSRSLKYIKKAKRFLKVKSLGKALGPIFDVVSIGVNSYGLYTAIRDCNNDAEACDPSAMTSAAFSIASGIVGVGTFLASLVVGATVSSVLGPAGAVVSLCLAITATLIELLWKPKPTQAQLDRELKEKLMREFDRISRLQLYNANMFLNKNDVERSDLYVVNQGHLPKWFSHHTHKLRFGLISANQLREKQPLKQPCWKPMFGDAPIGNQPYTARECPYLIDGEKFLERRSENSLGYSFYGFTKSGRDYAWKHSETDDYPDDDLDDDPDYDGSILLIGTDKVQPDALSEYENMNAKLRGLEINTATEPVEADAFNDLIVIGDMHSLDAGEIISIKMGSGNDALTIGGRIGSFSRENVLQADLGTNGHNILSFGAISSSSPIKGVEYDAKTGAVYFKHGSSGVEKQSVGTVNNVEVLSASEKNDYIKLYANKQGSERFDFTVFKFKGKATYELNIEDLAGQTETRHFKIVDESENVQKTCTDHVPVLKLINFDRHAVSNDVLYKNDRIKIYGQRATHRRYFSKLVRQKKQKGWKRNTPCSGEPSDGSHPKGGQNGKELLAIIALYSKCPVEIQSTNNEGGCMMRPKKKMELDLAFFQGKKLLCDFSRDISGSDGADHCYLTCPEQAAIKHTTINLGKGSQDRLIMGEELFIAPCAIDDSTHAYPIGLMKMSSSNWILFFNDVPKLSYSPEVEMIQHLLDGVDKIVNEYGDIIVDLRTEEERSINLYDRYAESTMRKMAFVAGEERTEEIKNDLLQCMKEESSMTDDEKETCGVV